MFSSIHTSEKNKQTITDLTNKLQLGTENIIARIAFAYSLSLGEPLNLKKISDSKGKEYSKKVLFGDNEPYYIAAICQFYGIYKSNQEIPRYIKMHLDHGLEQLHDKIGPNSNMYSIFLIVMEGRSSNI